MSEELYPAKGTELAITKLLIRNDKLYAEAFVSGTVITPTGEKMSVSTAILTVRLPDIFYNCKLFNLIMLSSITVLYNEGLYSRWVFKIKPTQEKTKGRYYVWSGLPTIYKNSDIYTEAKMTEEVDGVKIGWSFSNVTEKMYSGVYLARWFAQNRQVDAEPPYVTVIVPS